MERLTIRVPEDLLEAIDRRADADDVSQSEAARQLLRRGSEYERLRAERDRLERQLRATNQRVDEHRELVRYAEAERERQRDRRARRSAPAWTRAKWWLLGEPIDRNGAESPPEQSGH